MFIVNRIKIRSFERGILFHNGEFKDFLKPGNHWFFDPLNRKRVEIVSMRAPWLVHPDLDMICRSDKVGDELKVLDLNDSQRALVWVDGRFHIILGPGLAAYWEGIKTVKVEVINAQSIHFTHAALTPIIALPGAHESLYTESVLQGFMGVLFIDGAFVDLLRPGRHAFWKGMGEVRIVHVDMRESVLDVAGQEIMTADKVTLRLNALVTYQVINARQVVEQVDDFVQALYRQAQLALRAVIGTRELDALLSSKDEVAQELESIVDKRAAEMGIKVLGLGIRDIILPGEMKNLLNKVTEAKKAMEANLITRREEVAAMRSQANTAKLLENNPTLMRLRELEVLEKIATNSKLNVVLGEKGLADRIVNLI